MTLRDNSRDEVRYFVKGKARRIVVSSVLVAGLAIGGASYVLRQVQANLGGNPPQSATARKSTMTAPSGPRLATVAAASAQSGSFTGPVVNVYYGNVQVEAVVKNGKVQNVVILQHPNDNGTSIYINSVAMPYLIQEAVQAQSANIQLISGATFSSMGFVKSLTGALSQAGA